MIKRWKIHHGWTSDRSLMASMLIGDEMTYRVVPELSLVLAKLIELTAQLGVASVHFRPSSKLRVSFVNGGHRGFLHQNPLVSRNSLSLFYIQKSQLTKPQTIFGISSFWFFLQSDLQTVKIFFVCLSRSAPELLRKKMSTRVNGSGCPTRLTRLGKNS